LHEIEQEPTKQHYLYSRFTSELRHLQDQEYLASYLTWLYYDRILINV